MKALAICLSCAFTAVSAAALADTHPPLNPPKVYTPSGPPPKTRWKSSSSFAPRPGGTKQRVYGAPIQGKILRMQPKKAGGKPVPPKS
ncbi:MAG TPA: hypothetical protein VHB68_08095 [Steroidobacteraceae bacterium]|nr:hypothetical protein [Steroidobacteraceae bacterium]